MTAQRSFWWLVLGTSLLGCGGRSKAMGDEAEEPGQRVVVTTLFMDDTGSYQSEGLVCATGQVPVSLGLVGEIRVSPDARYVAVAREGVVDIVSLVDNSSTTLPGEGVTLEGARWSDSGERFAYFADGVPMLIDADGSDVARIELDVPRRGWQSAEWSRDDRLVAFMSAGVGVLAEAGGEPRGTFSTSMISAYGSPWALSFSADGRYLAGLQATEYEQRSVVLVDTETLETQTISDIEHYMFVGWTSDDAAVGLWDTSVQLWLIPRNGSGAMSLGPLGLPSPTGPELALGGPGLSLHDLRDGTERMLLPEAEEVQALRWLPDGKAVGYVSTFETTSGYVAVADGRKLADSFGVTRADGWAALPDPDNRDSGLLTRDLYGSADSVTRLAMEYPSQENANGALVNNWRVSWLDDGRLAFLSDDGVHIADKDGSRNRVVCPVAEGIALPQPGRLEAY